MSEPRCPFCGRDPFHYVDIGVGMEAAAVVCCELGDLFFRGARPEPETVTLAWEDFSDIGNRLAAKPERERVITDEMVESAAREFERHAWPDCPWESIHETGRERYRQAARDGLTAALKGTPA